MSLTYDEIAEIIKLIDSSSCDELVVETGDIKLVVRRNGASAGAAAEYVERGAAPVTVGLMREAGLALIPYEGSWWTARGGSLLPGESRVGYMRQFHQALMAEKADLPVAEFLERHFAEPRFAELRRSVTRILDELK